MDRLKRLARQRRNRAHRVRRRVRGTAERPRLSVHRTNKHIYAQVIDDISGCTIVSASSVALKLGYGGNVEAARKVGDDLGQKAKDKGIVTVGFDRGSSRFHGRVKALAERVREAGVKF